MADGRNVQPKIPEFLYTDLKNIDSSGFLIIHVYNFFGRLGYKRNCMDIERSQCNPGKQTYLRNIVYRYAYCIEYVLFKRNVVLL